MSPNNCRDIFSYVKLSFSSPKQIPLLFHYFFTKFGCGPPQTFFRLVLLFSVTFKKSSDVFSYLATVIAAEGLLSVHTLCTRGSRFAHTKKWHMEILRPFYAFWCSKSFSVQYTVHCTVKWFVFIIVSLFPTVPCRSSPGCSWVPRHLIGNTNVLAKTNPNEEDFCPSSSIACFKRRFVTFYFQQLTQNFSNKYNNQVTCRIFHMAVCFFYP